MSQSYKLPIQPPSTWTLFLLMSFPAVAGVFFTPSIPAIIHYFHVPKEEAVLGVTFFLFFYAVSQLLYPPISNLRGRKFALYLGIFLAFSSCFLALLASFIGFGMLLFARCIQGLGAGVCLNTTFTIINDVYYKNQAKKILPIVSLSFASLPFLAIFLAGFLTMISWQAVFFAFSFYCLFLLWKVHFLPETHPEKDRTPITLKKIGRGYRQGFSDPRLMLYGLLFGCTTSMIYLFAATAPILVTETWGYSAGVYGALSLIPSLGYISGSLLARYLHCRYSPRKSIFLGILVIFFANTFLQVFFSELGLISLFVPAYFIYVGIPLSHTNASLLATTHFPDRSIAGGIMSFTNVFFAFLAVQILDILPNVSFPSAFFVILLCMLTLFFAARNYD